MSAALAVRAALGAVVVLMAVLTFVAAASAQGLPSRFTADFTYSPAAPAVHEPVTFTSTSTVRAGRALVGEDWDLDGDGQFDVSGHSVMHTFLAPGTYAVTLKVQDDRGRIKTTSKSVTVSSAPTAPSAPSPPPRPPVSPPPSSPVPLPTPATGSVAIGAPAPPMAIVPFPVVRITGIYSTLGVRLRLFAVTAPAGVMVTVRCQGRGCPYRQRGPFMVRKSDTRSIDAPRYVGIRGFRGRLLKPGVRLRVFVSHRQQIGKYTRFTIRRRHPPLRVDRCLHANGSVFLCG